MKKLLLFAFALALFSTGCKKESGSGGNCTLSNSSLPGVYKKTAEAYQQNAQAPIEDDFSNLFACEKDDLLTVKTDGTYTISEGAVSCTPPTQAISGSWNLNGNNLNISFSGGFSISTTISDFTCNSFKLKYVDPDAGSITVTTYARQ
jgi:hypothetical protein